MQNRLKITNGRDLRNRRWEYLYGVRARVGLGLMCYCCALGTSRSCHFFLRCLLCGVPPILASPLSFYFACVQQLRQLRGERVCLSCATRGPRGPQEAFQMLLLPPVDRVPRGVLPDA